MAVKPKTDEFTVAIGVDRSECAMKAIRFYFERMYRQNHKVVFIHSAEKINTAELLTIASLSQAPHSFDLLTPDLWRNMIYQQKNETETLQREIIKMIPEKTDYSWSVINDGVEFAGAEVIKEADRLGAGTIVVGTRGLGTLRRTVLGSVSDYVVHHSKVPVVVCQHD